MAVRAVYIPWLSLTGIGLLKVCSVDVVVLLIKNRTSLVVNKVVV